MASGRGALSSVVLSGRLLKGNGNRFNNRVPHPCLHENGDLLGFSHISSDQLSMADLLHFLGDTCIPVTYAPGWVMPGMRFEVEQVADQPCIDLWRPINPASTPASNACLIWPWRSAGPAPGHPPRSAHHATRCGDAPLEPR